jgi:dienelactone hydrolase
LAQQPGRVAERIVAKDHPQQSYALYLPTTYTAQKPSPVLFVFDPDAGGKDAVEVWRAAAEKYGYIVAASNNSKNGPVQPQIDAIVAMYSDVVQRFAVNHDRLYAAGFSGGARVAGLMTFYCNRCLRAVIACGAGLPGGLKPEHFKELPPYFFTVGKADFNYFEVLDAARSHTAPAAIAIFDGTHQWAPPDVAMEAVAWLEAGARERRLPPATPAEDKERKKQLELVSPVFSAMTRAAQPQQASAPMQLGDTSDMREGSGGGDYGDAKSEMAALKKKREQAKGDDIMVYRRALSQAFAYIFENGQDYEIQKRFELAAHYYEVASAAIAPNPHLTYRIASAWAAAGQKKKALSLLKDAVKLGFHDADAVARDSHFDALRDSADFKAIVASMR